MGFSSDILPPLRGGGLQADSMAVNPQVSSTAQSRAATHICTVPLHTTTSPTPLLQQRPCTALSDGRFVPMDSMESMGTPTSPADNETAALQALRYASLAEIQAARMYCAELAGDIENNAQRKLAIENCIYDRTVSNDVYMASSSSRAERAAQNSGEETLSDATVAIIASCTTVGALLLAGVVYLGFRVRRLKKECRALIVRSASMSGPQHNMPTAQGLNVAANI